MAVRMAERWCWIGAVEEGLAEREVRAEKQSAEGLLYRTRRFSRNWQVKPPCIPYPEDLTRT